MQRNGLFSDEYGITPSVHTIFSRISLLNIIEIICAKKIQSINNWFRKKNIVPVNCLIIGSYLTGLRLANFLCNSCNVTVFDINPGLRNFLNPKVNFSHNFYDINVCFYDTVIDTTGLGGIKPETIALLPSPLNFIIEDPCSDGSDKMIIQKNQISDLLQIVKAKNKGILFTYGLGSKTSGTMSLMVQIVRNAMNDSLTEDGVLYSSSYLDFFERIIFKENDPEKFLYSLAKPALILSTMKIIDSNRFIENNLKKVTSETHDFWGS